MLQNLISLTIAPERLKSIDTTLTALESLFDDFIELSVAQRRELLKLGPRSEVFCRETISVMERNPGVLPADFPMDDVLEDRAEQELLGGEAVVQRRQWGARAVRDPARGRAVHAALGEPAQVSP